MLWLLWLCSICGRKAPRQSFEIDTRTSSFPFFCYSSEALQYSKVSSGPEAPSQSCLLCAPSRKSVDRHSRSFIENNRRRPSYIKHGVADAKSSREEI
jgi:hypothetical protein